MLVLTRTPGEQIVIEGDGRTVITVVELRGNKVRIGLEAPLDITIDRREVFEAKQQDLQNKELESDEQQ